MTHKPSPELSWPDGDVPWDGLGRLLAGEVTTEEKAHLLRWIAADPRREELVEELRELWSVTEPGNPSRDPEQVLAAIRRRDAKFVHDIATHRRFAAALSPSRLPRRAVAAAAVVILVGGWWGVRAIRSGSGQPAPLAAQMLEHRTARGQRLALTLPDGSTVMLGPESVLRYAAAYGSTNRTVELDGEGYFDVLHDAAHPFIVRAGHAVARDIGTRFVVRARRDGTSVDVAVKNGRVALAAAGQSMADAVLLDPNDIGRVDLTGHTTTVRHDALLNRYLGWTEGRLVFEATPLATVAAELSRWYDVDVQFEGPALGARQLTATFHNEPISTVLPMIQASLGLDLRMSGRHYVLSDR